MKFISAWAFCANISAGWAAAFVAATLSGCTMENISAPNKPDPTQTHVLLLPPLDVTPDSAHMLAPRQTVILRCEKDDFEARHFKILDEAVAAKAADSVPRIDLTRQSSRTKANLERLARRTGADWVVSIVVEKVTASNVDHGAFTARTQVLLQTWDASRRGWLANGLYTGQDSGNMPVWAFMHSLENATQTALTNVWNVASPEPPAKP